MQQGLKAECDQHKMRHIAFGAIGEISTRGKGGWPGLDKSDGR